MQIIDPVAVTDETLTAASLAEDDHAEWLVGTTYNLGDRVIVVSVHKVFESAINSNTGHDPATDDGSNWIEVGATNRWKPFDARIADPAVGVTSISYEFTPAQRVSAVALFGLSAESVTVTISDGVTTLVYSQDLTNYDAIVGWYSWLYSGIDRDTEALFIDLPYLGATSTITVEISAASGVSVAVGQIVFGDLFLVGKTRLGAEVGILDASIKSRDEYNRFVILERDASESARVPIYTENGNVRRIQRKLKSNRARPLVWIGDDDPRLGLVIYGFFQDYRQTLSLRDHTEIMLYIEGLS